MINKQQAELIADSRKKFVPIKGGDLSGAKRNNVFRNTIMSVYDYTCSICKMQVITLGPTKLKLIELIENNENEEGNEPHE